MNNREAAQQIVENSKKIINKGVSIFENIKILWVGFIHENAEIIIQTKDEKNFIDTMAIVGDICYKGNVFKEQFDKLVFKYILKLLDKFIIDKVFGKDWFKELKKKAQDFVNIEA